ncbi:hypothetical protein RJ639_030377 [Escallonia herrerae]|uniref:ZF-HD dimerization-type domain-containing protein n=1 Tax=Escallonia herrerae TaxID=1293975 RepID=A0AA88WY68_9ASTE|nr:hypothetical protein RJ639_030377 [Escallonia herrerae]
MTQEVHYKFYLNLHPSLKKEKTTRAAVIFHTIFRDMRPKGAAKKLCNGVSLKVKLVKYRGCMKNHAASIGGYAVDGCCEFMPAGEEGTDDPLRCAACGCHEKFHAREIEMVFYFCHWCSVALSPKCP